MLWYSMRSYAIIHTCVITLYSSRYGCIAIVFCFSVIHKVGSYYRWRRKNEATKKIDIPTIIYLTGTDIVTVYVAS